MITSDLVIRIINFASLEPHISQMLMQRNARMHCTNITCQFEGMEPANHNILRFVVRFEYRYPDNRPDPNNDDITVYLHVGPNGQMRIVNVQAQ